MSLLFPGMLLGLLGLAIPVVLHLIARHKYQVQEFPTIQLLRADERTNVFAMRLVDVGQLLLRLAVLLLLVLAMARFFVAGWPFGRAARNLVVVVDCSASMQALSKSVADGRRAPLIEIAKSKAEELLRGIAAPSQCALVAAGRQVEQLAPLQPSPQEALRALAAIKPADGTGCGLAQALARGCDLVRGRRETRSQIVVLTDLAASAFEARNQEDLRRIEAAQRELGRRLEIVFLDVAGAQGDNVALLDAQVRGSRAKVGDDAHVVARVLNGSPRERKAKLQLAVGERREPLVKEVTLAPGAEADVDLTLRTSRAGRAMVDVRLDGHDDFAADDRLGVPLDVADARRVLIVHDAGVTGETPVPAREPGSGGIGILPVPKAEATKGEPEEALDGVKILRFVLNPGRELGRPYGTGIQTTTVTPDALTGQPLSKYDLVVLYDVSTLAEQALKDLDTFVRQGRALLFVCSGGTNAMKFNRTFASASAERPALAPAEVGNERPLDPPTGIRFAGSQHPVLAPFRDRLRGDLSAVRFAVVRGVRSLAPGASVMLSGTDGSPLAVEAPIGQGRAVLLAFGFELDRGTLARTRVFPALMWQLVSYLTGDLRSRRPDVLTAERPAVLDVSEPAFAFLDELELAPLAMFPLPSGEGRVRAPDAGAAPASAPLTPPSPGGRGGEPPLRLAVSGEKTVLLPGLPVGQYVVQKPQQAAELSRRAVYGRYVAVNPDPRESRTERMSEAELASLFGGSARVAGLQESLGLDPAGGELWPLLMVLLILAYAAEGGVGWVLNARRERQRVAGGSQ